ncbi:hypothetical protein ES703_79561 [subsurface metagenome]
MNITAVIAMFLIAGLLILAVVNHINGALLAGGIGIIAGLGGYLAAKKRPTK